MPVISAEFPAPPSTAARRRWAPFARALLQPTRDRTTVTSDQTPCWELVPLQHRGTFGRESSRQLVWDHPASVSQCACLSQQAIQHFMDTAGHLRFHQPMLPWWCRLRQPTTVQPSLTISTTVSVVMTVGAIMCRSTYIAADGDGFGGVVRHSASMACRVHDDAAVSQKRVRYRKLLDAVLFAFA